jgi:hypothetical protein
MYAYLNPRNGPVVDGMEDEEVVYARFQPPYIPLRTLVSDDRNQRVVSRWTLTDEQREAIAQGADIFLELLTFGEPLQPIRVAVSEGDLDTDWVRVCLLSQKAQTPIVKDTTSKFNEGLNGRMPTFF